MYWSPYGGSLSVGYFVYASVGDNKNAGMKSLVKKSEVFYFFLLTNTIVVP